MIKCWSYQIGGVRRLDNYFFLLLLLYTVVVGGPAIQHIKWTRVLTYAYTCINNDTTCHDRFEHGWMYREYNEKHFVDFHFSSQKIIFDCICKWRHRIKYPMPPLAKPMWCHQFTENIICRVLRTVCWRCCRAYIHPYDCIHITRSTYFTYQISVVYTA